MADSTNKDQISDAANKIDENGNQRNPERTIEERANIIRDKLKTLHEQVTDPEKKVKTIEFCVFLVRRIHEIFFN